MWKGEHISSFQLGTDPLKHIFPNKYLQESDHLMNI